MLVRDFKNLRYLSMHLFLLGCLLAGAVPADQALQMPLASQSLILDATRAGDRLLVAGDYGHILYSDDAGVSWTQASVPTRRMLTALHFPTPTRGWAVGHDGLILATVDGGAHWTLQRDGLVAQRQLNKARVREAQTALEAARSSLLQSETVQEKKRANSAVEDCELELQDAEEILQEPVSAPPLLDVFFSDELHGVAVGAFNILLRTNDGGVNWLLESSQLENPDEYHLNAITGDAKGKLWIAAEGGLLFRNTAADQPWEVLRSPYRGSWFGIAHAPDSSALLVFGLRGNLFRSVDNGDTWERVATDSDRTLAAGIFINDDYVLLAGAVGTLLISEDSGMTFRSHSLGRRSHLSAVTSIADSVVVAGQGGVLRISPFRWSP